MSDNIVAFIFARGGSKGVPQKNIRPLAGKPLIAYAIETARASRLVRKVVVSTDSPEIAEVARRFGADVPFLRPAELATDTAPEKAAWQHAVRALGAVAGEPKIDVFVSVPTTSPLRAVEDVDACIRALLDTDAELVLTVTEARRNPYFNMVTIDSSGCARIAIPSEGGIGRRQDAQPVYDITTVAYAARPDYVLSSREWYDARVRAVLVPPDRALDIDTELDFEIAEYLVGRRAAGKGRP